MRGEVEGDGRCTWSLDRLPATWPLLRTFGEDFRTLHAVHSTHQRFDAFGFPVATYQTLCAAASASARCWLWIWRVGRVFGSTCYRAEGLDYSSELITRLRNTYPNRTWSEARTQSMPYADATFDAIVSWGVIEHDPNGPHQALSEFRRVLNPHGRIIVTVPVDTPRMRSDSKAQFPQWR